MTTAYSPGLTVSSSTVLRRTRRLPIKGEVLVEIGDSVSPTTSVARALLPGLMQSVKTANILGIGAGEVEAALVVKIGDTIDREQVIARTSSLFGMFKSECKSPVAGVFESFSHANGSVGIRRAPDPVVVNAYISGNVVEVLPGEGVVIETNAALVQGIFGVGGERSGTVRTVAAAADSVLDESMVDESMAGCIVVAGSMVTADALKKATAVGVVGVVAGGVVDNVLADFLGFDIGVAITGDENIDLTLIITEGFGSIPMAERTFNLLKSLDGQTASVNGATQIRAGVIRPELVVPHASRESSISAPSTGSLVVGTPIRIVREPYFGQLAQVNALRSQLCTVESGATVRVLEARLPDGSLVTVPRANVEVMESR